MKKLTRDLKKHYRDVKRKVREFEINLSDDSWYNVAHWHLDMPGFSDINTKHRKNHFMYYKKLLDTIEIQTRGSSRNFQTYIFIDGEWGGYDAIFFHTKNPHSDFPMVFENIQFDIVIPAFINEIFDDTMYRVGKIDVDYIDEDTNEHKSKTDYIIQKNGLGHIINSDC
jgi:hypothetical protein